MPGSRGVMRWTRKSERAKQPFSYMQVCRSIERIAFLSAIILLMVFSDRLDRYSNPVVIIGSLAAGTIALMSLLEKLVWKVLPERIRERVPYDSVEAMQDKGDIRTYGQLLSALFK